jgi:hypothetical protein
MATLRPDRFHRVLHLPIALWLAFNVLIFCYPVWMMGLCSGVLSLTDTSTLVLLYGGNFSANSSTTLTDTDSELSLGGGGSLHLHGSLTGLGSVQVMAGTHLWPEVVDMPTASLRVSKGAAIGAINDSLSLVFDRMSVNGTITAQSLELRGLRSVKLGPTGNLSADGLGYAGGAGPGAGVYGKEGGGGGGHAGFGGNGMNTSGGAAYGSVYVPQTAWRMGSGGGGSKYGQGARGGGRVRVWSQGTVTLQGSVSASGATGGQGAGGGGAGGSVVINATTCAGGEVATAS